jgi:predicted transposase YbfD/YdcC
LSYEKQTTRGFFEDMDLNHSEWVDDSQNAVSKGFIEYFKLVENPNQSSKTSHSLLEIIFISVCAYLCGANSWDGVSEFAKAREAWLRRHISLANGLPSRATYWRAFASLEPQGFQKCFQEWARTLMGPTKHIAIDGKTLRGVYDPKDSKASFILVSAWATDRGILLGQVKTDTKSNEITVIPELLDVIRVKDCLISIDAMGCQVSLAKKITELGGEYLFALKGNQGTLKNDVEAFFDDMISLNWKNFDYEYVETLEKGHGRIDSRKTYMVKADDSMKEKWANIHSLILIVSSREIKGNETIEHRYYISSSPMKVDEVALAIRRHWSIENGFHWSMDVGFREDRQVAQINNVAENLAVLRRIAFNLLNQMGKESRPLSIENKRLKAAMSTDFLEKILGLAI